MNNIEPSRLRVFLCHASQDKSYVRTLYQKLHKEGMEPWFDEENLMPGQDWDSEIKEAIRYSDVIIVCLSNNSVNKVGYVQKEIKFSLDIAELHPEREIFIIPARIEKCNIPLRLEHLHVTNLYEEKGYKRLIDALRIRAESLDRIFDTSGYEEDSIINFTGYRYYKNLDVTTTGMVVGIEPMEHLSPTGFCVRFRYEDGYPVEVDGYFNGKVQHTKKVYYKDGKVYEKNMFQDNKLVCHLVYHYNRFGMRSLKEIHRDGKQPQMEIEYDLMGRRIREKCYDAQGNLDEFNEFAIKEFSYNELGQKEKEIWFDAKGNEMKRIE